MPFSAWFTAAGPMAVSTQVLPSLSTPQTQPATDLGGVSWPDRMSRTSADSTEGSIESGAHAGSRHLCAVRVMVSSKLLFFSPPDSHSSNCGSPTRSPGASSFSVFRSMFRATTM
eukprot:CAMPEP_0174294992 /NCGR_PEP_ID=MMETSP0809-20121228/43303_1 /TAXON_ID=73025 ORGANISM="Eutreptiella gymnastica-like, Strain CCMP1594" /NCGR_SAMPLE_ID=MMETSP0809 /ASSEMBLY_ACC=CAM_ASM_000658 /LENGTH=114 /DNA_ID=CAMNT_0015396885 /DNA_START=74 /DNA_END=415 /DNA_ORIENTATION=-